MFVHRTSSMSPVASLFQAPKLPPDEVLIGLAALSLKRLWNDQKMADGIGDRIEQDLWSLPKGSKLSS